MKTTTTTTPTTTTAPTFNGADFASGIMRDKRRGAAGFSAMKGATILIDALRAAGCSAEDLPEAIREITNAYRRTLTDKGAGSHGDAVRLIAGV